MLQRGHRLYNTAIARLVVRADVHLRVCLLRHNLTDLGLQLFQAHGAVSLIFGVQFAAQIPVIPAISFNREGQNLLWAVIDQGFAGNFG